MKELSLDNCRLDKRYDIFAQLGRGSYAEIFVARDTLAAEQSPHRMVAIKALNVFLQDDLDPELERTLVENFQNEAVALDRVRHPNIISRLGHGTARDTRGTLFHYLVLEFLEGGDLQKSCREKPPALKAALKYIEQTCAGLRHAHRHGVIHRDIKPQNLLLTKDRETVKIADFGVARLNTSDAPITRVGTNIYAAPEHSPLGVDGNVMVVPVLTPAADIYSLAKSVYALLTREAPRFYANQQITDLPLSVRNEDWAAELKRVLAKATSREPEERHQSVDEFWQDMEGIRRYADEFETATNVRPKFHQVPQPHVARGYSPIAPQQARFDTSRELKMRHQFGSAVAAPAIDIDKAATPKHPVIIPTERVEDHWPAPNKTSQFQIEIPNAVGYHDDAKPKRKGKFLRRFLTGILLLVLFSGALYLTHSFLKNSGLLPDIAGVFGQKTGRANTDINLRPSPNLNNEPIGLVTRNSRVRIVKAENNWYQVDVLEQGRERDDAPPATRGWLNSKYVVLDQ
ncbi:MAG: protein kinase [Acidobacteria bacterium]|nr:protein kinase [Acidobacteriota bacterium]